MKGKQFGTAEKRPDSTEDDRRTEKAFAKKAETANEDGKNGDLSTAAVGKIDRAYRLLLERFGLSFPGNLFPRQNRIPGLPVQKNGVFPPGGGVLVGALEKNGKIEFQGSRRGMRYGAWGVRSKG